MTKHYTQAELDHALKAERYRYQLVVASAAYKGRETAAQQMLQSTDMSSEAIIGALSGMTHGNQQHPSSDVQGGQQNDFAKGKEIASSLPPGMRR
jgi:hypothetical protein